MQQFFSLFDHPISTGLQRLWHSQTERLDGIEINGEFVLGGNLNRKIDRLLTSKNAINIIVEIIPPGRRRYLRTQLAGRIGMTRRLCRPTTRLVCRHDNQ